jgi:hypothetical protein
VHPRARKLATGLLDAAGLMTPVRGRATRLDLARRRAAERLAVTAGSLHDRLSYVGLQHLPPRRAEPRWGHGRPVHPGLERIIGAHRWRYEQVVRDLLGQAESLTALPVHPSDDVEPCWRNAWLPGLDTAVLYTLLRTRQPRHYVEVGSGYSTQVVARAVRDGGLPTRVTSIDPEPRAGIDALCDVVLRAPMEDVPPSLWQDLEAGDVVFVDNSHRALMHSDATVFFLEVLPTLPHGVLVGVHDVLLPADYFASWSEYLFSEQYLLAAYLLAGAPWLQPVFAAYWSSALSDVTAPLAAFWDALGDPGIDRRGWSFWMEINRPDLG